MFAPRLRLRRCTKIRLFYRKGAKTLGAVMLAPKKDTRRTRFGTVSELRNCDNPEIVFFIIARIISNNKIVRRFGRFPRRGEKTEVEFRCLRIIWLISR